MFLIERVQKKLIQNIQKILEVIGHNRSSSIQKAAELEQFLVFKLITDLDDFRIGTKFNKYRSRIFALDTNSNFLFRAELSQSFSRNKLFYLKLLRDYETQNESESSSNAQNLIPRLNENLIVSNVLTRYQILPSAALSFISKWVDSIHTYDDGLITQYLLVSFLSTYLGLSEVRKLSSILLYGLQRNIGNKFLLCSLQLLSPQGSSLVNNNISLMVNHVASPSPYSHTKDALLNALLEVHIMKNFLKNSYELKAFNSIRIYCSKYRLQPLNLPSRSSIFLLPDQYVRSFPETVLSNVSEGLLSNLQRLNIEGLELFTHLDNYFDNLQSNSLFETTLMFKGFITQYLNLSDKYLDSKSQLAFKTFLYKCMSNLNSEFGLLSKNPITMSDLTNAFICKGQIITVSLRFLTYFIFSVNSQITKPLFTCLNILLAQKQLFDDLYDYFDDFKNDTLNVCHCILKSKGLSTKEVQNPNFYWQTIAYEAYKILRIYDSVLVKNLRILDDIFGFKLTYIHNERYKNLLKIYNLNQDRIDYLNFCRVAFATTAKNPYDKHNAR